MREIKFRAWDKESKVMYEPFQLGQYMSYNEGAQERLVPSTEQNTVLLQYTGLQDRNGVEIYEGDILGLVHKKNGLINKQTVVWDNEAACFDWETTNDDSWPDGFSGFVDEYEVIGNIWENPELLK